MWFGVTASAREEAVSGQRLRRVVAASVVGISIWSDSADRRRILTCPNALEIFTEVVRS